MNQSICLSIVSVNQSVNQSINQSINRSINQSQAINQSYNQTNRHANQSINLLLRWEIGAGPCTLNLSHFCSRCGLRSALVSTTAQLSNYTELRYSYTTPLCTTIYCIALLRVLTPEVVVVSCYSYSFPSDFPKWLT